MLFMKNLPAWERILRSVAGIAMAGAGLYLFTGSPLGYGMAAAGLFTALTGFVGFCPACALVGRRLKPGR